MKDDWTSLSGEQRKQYTIRIANHYGWFCHYCKLPIKSADELTCEHLTPRSKGGKTTLENCRPSCGPCNYSRGAAVYQVQVIEHDGISLFWSK